MTTDTAPTSRAAVADPAVPSSTTVMSRAGESPEVVLPTAGTGPLMRWPSWVRVCIWPIRWG